jgi:hypothetical protein
MGSGELRRPLFVAAVVVAVLVVAVELGFTPLLSHGTDVLTPAEAAQANVPSGWIPTGGVQADTPPGMGIAYLGLVDGLLLFVVLLLGSSLLVSQRTYGRVQGIVTLVVALVWVVLSALLALLALSLLLLMVGLFVAVPFGTLAYLAIWGFFPVAGAAAVLGLLLLLKGVLFGLLLGAQPRFLRVKGLMSLLAVSVVLQLVLGLVHGFLPGPVVSIGDEVWALVTAVVALVWAVVMLIGAIPAIVNAIRVSASISQGA